ncbi:MAG: hypothetical protein CfClM3_0511 [Methanobrevibacter sp. CfCl-M3]
MKLINILLLVAFIGLLCSVNAYQNGNTFNFGASKVVNVNPLADDMITISSDGKSIQEAVDEISTKGTIYLNSGIYSKPGDCSVNIMGKDISLVGLGDGVIVNAIEMGRLFNIDQRSKVSMEKLNLYDGKI